MSEVRVQVFHALSKFIETGTLSANPITHTNLTHCFLATDVQLIGPPLHDETEQVDLALAALGRLPHV